MDNSKQATRQLAEQYAKQGDPDGWFEAFYTRANGDIDNIYWADLKPSPLLLKWVSAQASLKDGRALVVGCGLGDDAEALSYMGYRVIAFDISAAAISMCQKRYPASRVDYHISDLFSPPSGWSSSFDVVYECNTIQILTGSNRAKAVISISDMVALGGYVIVSCRSREEEMESDAFPVPVDRYEIDGFVRAGLVEVDFIAYEDNQAPSVPHFFAVYQRSGGK
jgi:SAM-dependent methyltransferase